MAKYISLGPFNRHYYKILYTVILMTIIQSFYGLKFNDFFITIQIFCSEGQKKFSKHNFVHQFFYFLLSFLYSFASYKIKQYIKNKNKRNFNELIESRIKKDEVESKIANSYQEPFMIKSKYKKENNNESKRFKIIFLIIIFLWSIQEQLFKIYKDTGIKALDFWTIELLIISIFQIKMFNAQIYIHQKFSILFSISLSILKIIKIFVSKDGVNSDIIKAYKWLIPVGLIAHILFMILRSYVFTKVKWYLDIKNISTNNILLAFYFIGTISFLCFTFITTFIKCSDNEFSKKLCFVSEDEEITYYENFIFYFYKFKVGGIEVFIEILAIIFGSILFFFKTKLHIFLIQYLSPIYVIFLQPIYFIFYKIILIAVNLIVEHTFFLNENEKSKEDINDMIKRIIIDIIQDVLGFIAFLIYLEIIELNFCKCNYNLKKNISKRGELDSSIELNESNFLFFINGDIEEVKKIDGIQRDSNNASLLPSFSYDD